MNALPILALRRLRRGWKSGELLILALSVAVAVAAATAVGLFTDRLRAAIDAQSSEAFGADAIVASRTPLPAGFLERLAPLQLQRARTAEFASVVLAGERSQMASVKAVSPGYPLRGALRLADRPFDAERSADGIPAPGTVWVDAQLWQDLDLAPGASLELGRTRMKVAGVITFEPDRGGGMADLAPRLMMSLDDLPATGLIGPGSRVSYGLMLAGPADRIAALSQLQLPPRARLETPQTSGRELRRTLDRGGAFLDIAVLAVALLSAAAVALSAQQHGGRLADEVALLRSLGADRRFVARLLGLDLLLLGAIAGAAGAALGYGAQAVLVRIVAGLLDAQLPPAGWSPVLSAWGLGLLMLLGFALPPVLAATRTPPIRVLQRNVAAGRSSLLGLLAAAAVIALLALRVSDPLVAAWFVAGAAAAVGVLAGLAWLLVRLLSPLRRAGGTALRFGLGNVARRRGATVAQVVALGLSLLALLLVTVVRTDLLAAWQNRLPQQAPNQFLINIQPDQVEPLQQFFAAHGLAVPRLWPMTRGRLVAVNGRPVTADTYDDPETQRWINREFNMTWTARFGPDNHLLSGAWWPQDATGAAELSIEQYAVERLRLGVGDRITLAIADQQIEFTVVNTRKTDWDSFQPNFFLATQPGVIDSADTQWLTSFYLPPGERGLLPALVREFPNVTALDLDALMARVRGIVDRIAHAIEFIFLFTLAAGIAVLLAAIEGTRGERVRETALLRTLGAGTRTIAGGLIAEYATLGIVAGVVAAIAAQAIAWWLARSVLEIPYAGSVLLVPLGAAGGALLVTLLGWASLYPTLRTPPRAVLR
jgi:putative ABC transport system permease protein